MIEKLKTITQDELIPALHEVGIKAKEYSNPKSIGNDAEFFISTSAGGRGILLKKGIDIGLKIATNDKHRQAVLNVTEKPRTVVRTYNFTCAAFNNVKSGITKASYAAGVAATARNSNPLVIPGATLTYTKPVLAAKQPKDKTLARYEVTVSAEVKETRTNTFLMGMDETSHFISILPKQVQSVEEAHDLLKPAELKDAKDVKRQGEFFFTPVEQSEVEDYIKDNKNHVIRKGVTLEDRSNHHAGEAVVNLGKWGTVTKVIYVRGLIYDKRGYRHAPIHLDEVWHKVTRNKEVDLKLQPSQRRRVRFD